MKQGEIWVTNLYPTKGSEQAGTRPVVIISGNLLNEHLNVVICVPLTTKIKNYKGNPILEPNKRNGLPKSSEMLIFHVRSIAKERLMRKLGQVEPEVIQQVVKTVNDLLKF